MSRRLTGWKVSFLKLVSPIHINICREENTNIAVFGPLYRKISKPTHVVQVDLSMGWNILERNLSQWTALPCGLSHRGTYLSTHTPYSVAYFFDVCLCGKRLLSFPCGASFASLASTPTSVTTGLETRVLHVLPSYLLFLTLGLHCGD